MAFLIRPEGWSLGLHQVLLAARAPDWLAMLRANASTHQASAPAAATSPGASGHGACCWQLSSAVATSLPREACVALYELVLSGSADLGGAGGTGRGRGGVSPIWCKCWATLERRSSPSTAPTPRPSETPPRKFWPRAAPRWTRPCALRSPQRPQRWIPTAFWPPHSPPIRWFSASRLPAPMFPARAACPLQPCTTRVT